MNKCMYMSMDILNVPVLFLLTWIKLWIYSLPTTNKHLRDTFPFNFYASVNNSLQLFLVSSYLLCFINIKQRLSLIYILIWQIYSFSKTFNQITQPFLLWATGKLSQCKFIIIINVVSSATRDIVTGSNI